MDVQIRHEGSSAIARCYLDPNESMRVEPGAMMAHTFGIEITSDRNGGFGQALTRSIFGNESYSISKFTNTSPHRGWVDIVAPAPGDMFDIEIDHGQDFMMAGSSWVANSEGVNLETRYGGVSSLLNTGSFAINRLSGAGKIIGSAYGSIDIHQLNKGEGFTLDNEHLVGYSGSINVSTRKAAKGWINTSRSGEGVVMDMMGPGIVVTQSRTVSNFVTMLLPFLPSNR